MYEKEKKKNVKEPLSVCYEKDKHEIRKNSLSCSGNADPARISDKMDKITFGLSLRLEFLYERNESY